MSNVFITGTSSGFGFLTAKTLVHDGHTVFATMRNLDGRNAENAAALRDATASGSGTLHTLELDVTDDQSVERAVNSAIETGGHLDVVINNAGVLANSYIEAYTAEQFRALFDVNLFGTHRVCRAALPHMRARKQGLIINVSSGIGRYLLPFFGPYPPTKFAVEAYSEGLAMELAATGVQVSIVQPGAFATNIFTNIMQAEDRERLASYGELAGVPEQVWAGMGGMMADAPPPQLVADKIAELISMPAGDRPLRAVVDPMTGPFVEAVNATCTQVQADIQKAFSGG
jgi:NAD(P)-dependent dehydrogenase (short-subunit alcohol dehydrogenase family)